LLEKHVLKSTSKESNKQRLKCYYTNAQSLENKFAELKNPMVRMDIKIAGITETWGNKDLTDPEISIEGYDLHREDKKSGRGGGVIMYVHESLKS
jgi:hypothetical protein